MKVTPVNVVFVALSGLALFSTANAADFPHSMHDRTREVRLERSERVGREHEARKNFGRELAGREHDGREHAGRQREGRELRSTGAVHPLPLYARAQSGPVGTKR